MACALAFALLGCNNNNAQPDKDPKTQTSETGLSRNVNLWPQIDSAIKADPAIEKRAKAILDKMTIEQKVAQVVQPEIRSITVEEMRQYGFGSYLNGGGAYPNDNKHATPKDWINLAEAMYQASVDDSIDGSTIPTMWGTDAVHGHNNVIGATLFPHNIGLGAARNPELIESIAAATAKEVLATGIDWIFAPTVATAQDDRWGRTYESYAESPDLVKAYSAAIVKGLQGSADGDSKPFSDDKVIATVKHFVGDGGTLNGDDQGDSLVSEQTLIDIHAQGYVGGLNAGAQTVMASFNSWHGSKIHGDKYLLTDVLKERMGFDGLVVGDWNGHGQVSGCTNDNCPQAINAGLDIYMTPNDDWRKLYTNLVEQVKTGVIPQARLDDAVTRILRVKLRAGLFDNPSPAKRALSGDQSLIGAAEHRAIARQAVQESLVLLKNNQNLLPLSGNQHILVAGDAADNIGKQSGGWTITWQGTGNQNSDFPGATSIYQGIKHKVEQAGGSVSLSVNGDFTTQPDVAVVVFGEEPYAEGNGDINNLEYQRENKRDLALLRKLKSQGIPVVAVFISGRPMWVNPELNAADAFVAAWLPGSEGQGVADVILRDEKDQIDHDFKGKLSFSWPATPTQMPNVLDGENDNSTKPLFEYGYGLTYSDSSELAALPETFKTDAKQTLTSKALYVGQVKKPWSIAAGPANALTTLTSSVLQTPEMRVQTIDRFVQEDALSIEWLATSTSEFGLYSPFPEDLISYLEADASLAFDYKIMTNQVNAMQLGVRCLDACDANIDITEMLQNNFDFEQPDTWGKASVALRCLSQKGATFSKMMSPFVLSSDKPNHIAISNLRIVPNAGKQALISCE
ncbi:exo 1,3/1,4-beta-D-glucan glucohydrolase [Alteromonas sp. a30]|nr:exo 1,3/1,4-beta-D-glucan glucohydrolase [Alteromonas sp. a30]